LLDVIGAEVGLAEAVQAGHDIVAGKIRGRVIVDVNR
jgi:acrylyl-CoA reductase (NADPH)